MDAMASRLLEAFEMWEDGVQIMRENLRRRLPGASPDELDLALDRWLAAPDPVDPGFAVVSWPRPRR